MHTRFLCGKTTSRRNNQSNFEPWKRDCSTLWNSSSLITKNVHSCVEMKGKTPVNGNVRSMAISSGKSLHHNLTATRKLVNDLQKYFRTMKLPCELSAVKFYAFLQKNANLLLRCTTKFTRFFSLSFHWRYAVCDS